MEMWAKQLKAKMVLNDIKSADLAKKLDVTRAYVSMVFHGKESPKNAEQRFNTAVDELIAERSKA